MSHRTREAEAPQPGGTPPTCRGHGGGQSCDFESLKCTRQIDEDGTRGVQACLPLCEGVLSMADRCTAPTGEGVLGLAAWTAAADGASAPGIAVLADV